MAHDNYIQQMYYLVYSTCNKVDLPIGKCTELCRLHMDYMRSMDQKPMTALVFEDDESLVDLRRSVMYTYF